MLYRNVSISVINRGFNNDVCVDDFHLKNLRLFHAIASYSRLAADLPVLSPSLMLLLRSDLSGLPIYPQNSVQCDLAFRHEEFIDYLSQYST